MLDAPVCFFLNGDLSACGSVLGHGLHESCALCFLLGNLRNAIVHMETHLTICIIINCFP